MVMTKTQNPQIEKNLIRTRKVHHMRLKDSTVSEIAFVNPRGDALYVGSRMNRKKRLKELEKYKLAK